MHWQKLSRLPEAKIRELQNKKLRYFIRHEAPFSPFYRKLFKKNNLSFHDIRSVADLKKIPFTTKSDIAPTKRDPSRPKNIILQPDEKLIKQHSSKLFLVSLAVQKFFGTDPRKTLDFSYRPVHLHFTTGRTSLPTPFLYSQRDIATLREAGSRLFDIFNVSVKNTVVNAFPYSPHLAFWQTYYATEVMGLLALHTGGGRVLPTIKIIKSIQSMKASVLAGMPGYCYYLFQKAIEEKADFSALKTLVLGGERVPKGLKDKLRTMGQRLGTKTMGILSTYAFTEAKAAWGQCNEGSGYHLYPDLELVEVVDKEGTPVEGEKGEIVYTTLDWYGSVVLRYKTGDLTKGLFYTVCPLCGRTVPRLDPDIQRSSEFTKFTLTKVKGVLVNLNDFFPLMMSHKSIEEWQVEIKKRRNDPYAVDELILYVAPKRNTNMYNLKRELKEKIRNTFEITPEIREVKKKVLLDQLGMDTELKEKRIIDRRPKK